MLKSLLHICKKVNEESKKIWFGKYWSFYVNEIPLEYLFWIFPKLKRSRRDAALFIDILKHFLTKYVSVVDRTKENAGYCFYFDTFKRYEPGSGKEIPFLISNWRCKDTNGEYVYEIDHVGTKIYIQQVDEKWKIRHDIIYHYWIYGGEPMVYEKNKEWYFKDGYDKIVSGAYLLRKPWCPDASIIDNFSENIKI